MRQKLLKVALQVVLAIIMAASAKADIALLTNGRSLKIAEYRVEGSQVQLSLQSGGEMTLPILQVERIVDDEIIPLEEAPAPDDASLFPARSWRFADQHLPIFSSHYDDAILEAGRKFDVDASFISAIIKAESDYQYDVVSHKGAVGLMQLMPATALRFGVTNSYDPVANIYAGTRYVSWLLEEFGGNPELVLAAYNAGEANVRKHEGVPPFRETVNFVARIAGFLRDNSKGETSSSE